MLNCFKLLYTSVYTSYTLNGQIIFFFKFLQIYKEIKTLNDSIA